ncbi:MAG: FtsX-like permease family protein, partial [Bacilli bacterium]
ILSNVLLKENNLLKYKGVINYILIIIIGIFSAKIIISLVAAILKKRSLFGLIFVDDVNRNNISKSILIILLVAFTSIVIFVGLTRVDERRVEKLYDETIIDLAITNIIREDDLELYLSNSTNVDVYEKGILYNNVVMNKEVSFSQMISVKNINYFFDFEIIGSEINEFNNSNYPVVFIPIEYQYLYNFSIGDEITLSLNEAYSEVPFKIIGFFSSNYEDLILTNLFLLEEYSILNYNTYFINSNNKNILKNELIDKYSKNLYYIIDFEELINEIDIYSKNLRTFLSFLSLFFVFCFVFTIINNSLLLFESNKNIFARLKILGCSKNNLRKNIILQYLLITFVCIICSSFAVFVIMFNVKYILLFFNVYQEIKLIFSDFIIGYIISSIVFFLSYLYYIKLSLNLNINVVLNDIDQ